jgi:hypothetical protein
MAEPTDWKKTFVLYIFKRDIFDPLIRFLDTHESVFTIFKANAFDVPRVLRYKRQIEYKMHYEALQTKTRGLFHEWSFYSVPPYIFPPLIGHIFPPIIGLLTAVERLQNAYLKRIESDAELPPDQKGNVIQTLGGLIEQTKRLQAAIEKSITWATDVNTGLVVGDIVESMAVFTGSSVWEFFASGHAVETSALESVYMRNPVDAECFIVESANGIIHKGGLKRVYDICEIAQLTPTMRMMILVQATPLPQMRFHILRGSGGMDLIDACPCS